MQLRSAMLRAAVLLEWWADDKGDDPDVLEKIKFSRDCARDLRQESLHMAKPKKKSPKTSGLHKLADRERGNELAWLKRANRQEKQIQQLTRQLDRAIDRADGTLSEIGERLSARHLLLSNPVPRPEAVDKAADRGR